MILEKWTAPCCVLTVFHLTQDLQESADPMTTTHSPSSRADSSPDSPAPEEADLQEAKAHLLEVNNRSGSVFNGRRGGGCT